MDNHYDSQGKPLALVVDDEPLLCMFGEDHLRDLGFEVLTCETASRALDMIAELPSVRLLMTDIRFPGAIDGWQLGAMARKRLPELCVLYVSGDSARPGVLAATERFLRKPYTQDELRAVTASLPISPV